MNKDSVTISSEMNDLEILQQLWALMFLEFPSDDDCWAELCRRAAEEGKLECRSCGHRDLECYRDGRVLRCPTCHNKTRLTSDTYLHKIKLPRIWLGAVWLLEHGVVVSAFAFHKVAKIAYSSASNVVKRLAYVIQGEIDESNPSVSSQLFSDLFCKRSTQTPAGVHPRDESPGLPIIHTNAPLDSNLDAPLAADADVRPHFVITDSLFNSGAGLAEELHLSCAQKAAADRVARLAGHEKSVYEVLGKEPTSIEELMRRFSEVPASELSVALTLLEIDNLISAVGGGRFVRREQKPVEVKADRKIKDTVGLAVDFIRGQFHGISWKYLQLYIALYWSRADRPRWRNGGLMKACMKLSAVSDAELYDGESPALCKLPLVSISP